MPTCRSSTATVQHLLPGLFCLAVTLTLLPGCKKAGQLSCDEAKLKVFPRGEGKLVGPACGIGKPSESTLAAWYASTHNPKVPTKVTEADKARLAAKSCRMDVAAYQASKQRIRAALKHGQSTPASKAAYKEHFEACQWGRNALASPTRSLPELGYVLLDKMVASGVPPKLAFLAVERDLGGRLRTGLGLPKAHGYAHLPEPIETNLTVTTESVMLNGVQVCNFLDRCPIVSQLERAVWRSKTKGIVLTAYGEVPTAEIRKAFELFRLAKVKRVVLGVASEETAQYEKGNQTLSWLPLDAPPPGVAATSIHRDKTGFRVLRPGERSAFVSCSSLSALWVNPKSAKGGARHKRGRQIRAGVRHR